MSYTKPPLCDEAEALITTARACHQEIAAAELAVVDAKAVRATAIKVALKRGASLRDIAAGCEVSPETVRNWVKQIPKATDLARRTSVSLPAGETRIYDDGRCRTVRNAGPRCVPR